MDLKYSLLFIKVKRFKELIMNLVQRRKKICVWQSEKARSYMVRSTHRQQDHSFEQVFSWIRELWLGRTSLPLSLFTLCVCRACCTVPLLTLWSRPFRLDHKHCVVLHGDKNKIDAQHVYGNTGHLADSAFDAVATSKTQSYH